MMFKDRRIFSLLLLILVSASPLLFSSVRSEDKIPPVKMRQDPFWEGASILLSLTDRQNDFRTQRILSTQFGYGFDNGVSLSAQVPVIVGDSNPSPGNAKTPRLGGGRDARAEIFGDFRLWGDTLDFFALNFGAGLPFQTDAATRDTSVNSWILPLSLYGRADFEWIAFIPSLTEIVNFPSSTDTGSSDAYVDKSNTILATVTVLLYPSRRLSPSISLTESFPSKTDRGVDTGDKRAYLTGRTENTLDRTLSFNLDWAPPKVPALISVAANYHFVNSATNLSPWQFIGRLRWLF